MSRYYCFWLFDLDGKVSDHIFLMLWLIFNSDELDQHQEKLRIALINAYKRESESDE